jgi:hypothetical protein
MIWVRGVLVGFAAAIVTAVITAIALSVFTAPVMMWWADIGEGSGSIGAFSSGAELLLPPAAIAFALGFRWSIRRARSKRTVSRA